MTTISVIGETVADAVGSNVDDRLRLDVLPGGSPANVAVGLARLGSPARFAGRLSRGALGQLLRRHLTDSGVDMSDSVDADGAATLAITALDPDGRAEYDFYTDGTADWQWRPEELATPSTDTVAIHTGSLALALPPGGAVIAAHLARHRGRATVSIDPNARPGLVAAHQYRERLPHWASVADLIKVSEDDLDHIHPGVPWTRIAADWHAAGVTLVVVTRGADGVWASLAGEPIEVPGITVDVADTIGAGDAFTAGLLHHLRVAGQLGGRLDRLDSGTARDALRFATDIAARTCRVPGADPPYAADL